MFGNTIFIEPLLCSEPHLEVQDAMTVESPVGTCQGFFFEKSNFIVRAMNYQLYFEMQSKLHFKEVAVD